MSPLTVFLIVVAVGLAVWLLVALKKVDVQKGELATAASQRELARQREDQLKVDNAYLDTLINEYDAAIRRWQAHDVNRNAYIHDLERDVKSATAAYNAAYQQLRRESYTPDLPEIAVGPVRVDVINAEIVDRAHSLDEALAGLREPEPLEDLSITTSFRTTDSLSPKKRHQLAQKHREQEVAGR